MSNFITFFLLTWLTIPWLSSFLVSRVNSKGLSLLSIAFPHRILFESLHVVLVAEPVYRWRPPILLSTIHPSILRPVKNRKDDFLLTFSILHFSFESSLGHQAYFNLSYVGRWPVYSNVQVGQINNHVSMYTRDFYCDTRITPWRDMQGLWPSPITTPEFYFQVISNGSLSICWQLWSYAIARYRS